MVLDQSQDDTRPKARLGQLDRQHQPAKLIDPVVQLLALAGLVLRAEQAALLQGPKAGTESPNVLKGNAVHAHEGSLDLFVRKREGREWDGGHLQTFTEFSWIFNANVVSSIVNVVFSIAIM
jgi:hypothetical protein